MELSKSKKGLTLVELICTLAILGFLFTILASITSTMSAQYVRIMDKTRAKSSATAILELLEPKLRGGTKALITDDVNAQGYKNVWYQANDGHFKLRQADKDQELFSTSFYENFKYKLEYYKMSDSTIKIVLYIRDQNDELIYTTQTVTAILNAKNGGGQNEKVVSKVGKDGGAVLMYS